MPHYRTDRRCGILEEGVLLCNFVPRDAHFLPFIWQEAESFSNSQKALYILTTTSPFSGGRWRIGGGYETRINRLPPCPHYLHPNTPKCISNSFVPLPLPLFRTNIIWPETAYETVFPLGSLSLQNLIYFPTFCLPFGLKSGTPRSPTPFVSTQSHHRHCEPEYIISSPVIMILLVCSWYLASSIPSLLFCLAYWLSRGVDLYAFEVLIISIIFIPNLHFYI